MAPPSRESVWGGGSATTVSTLQQGELSHRWPTFVPGGTAALFTVWNDTGWEPARIVAQNLATGTRTTVIEAGGGHGRIVRGGTSDYLVFARSEGLLAARFDLITLTITGQPVPVGAPLVTNLSGGAHFDVAGSTLAYVPGENAETSRSLAWVSVEGRVLSSRTVPQLGREWDLSPDGRHVARTNSLGSNRNVWLEDLERGTTTQVTTSAEHFQPVWSHDGKAVFVSRGTPAGPIYRRDLASGTEIRMTAGETAKYSEDTSPDGKWLLYRSATANAGFDLWLAPLNAAGGTEPSAARALVAQPFNEVNASFSPDSTRVAYQANANGRFDIFVKLLTDAAPTQVSLAGGVSPQWSVDGRQVWYRSAADNRLMAVGVDAQGRVTSPPRVLMDVSAFENEFAVAPDGSRLLMMPLLAAERAAATIDIVFDFLQELRQKVP